MTDGLPRRTPYQGLAQIFNYNRTFYVRTLAVAMGLIVISMYLSPAFRLCIALSTGAALFWTCSSLLVSYYIYDRSGLYSLRWLSGLLSRPPARWMNIHAGLDESSQAIRSMFRGSEGQIIDIYDPRRMTEPSIKRARDIAGLSSPSRQNVGLPSSGEDINAVFLIFTAHELRRQEDRVQLLREVARVLRNEGEVILVEHLRDWANFLAFGPGFFHFFSKRTWESAANAAGLPIRLHCSVTPFVHIFVLQKQT